MKAIEQITMLKRELQAYYDNASKGGANRRKKHDTVTLGHPQIREGKQEG